MTDKPEGDEEPPFNPFPKIVIEGFEHIDPYTYDFETCWTRVNRDKPYDIDDVVAAMLYTSGSYAEMSALLGRNRSRIRDYVLSHPEIRQIREDVQESNVDLVEKVGMRGALLGDLTQVRYVLSTLGKDRGYTTRTESTGKDGVPLGIDYSNLSEKELEDIIAIQSAAAARAKTGSN